MKSVAVLLAVLAAAPALAATPPVVTPAPAPAAVAAKLSIDTSIEALAADPKGKAVLDANFPGITAHPAYDQFKGMSLKAVQPMSNGAVTDEKLAAVATALAAIK